MIQPTINDGDHVGGAKARLLEASRQIDPLRPMRKHPFTTIGIGAVSGFLMGSNSHPAIMKTVRLSMSVIGLLRPAMLVAGKLAANHFAHDPAETPEGTIHSPVPSEGSA
ncbi:hypothetical protein BH10PLA1_BH10PLA1_14630 [soil metagenome]